MPLLGMLVNSGISYCNTIRNNAGYFIYPTKFSISDTAGSLTVNRTIDDINPEWYVGLISGYNPINTNALEIVSSIPPNSNGGVQTTISEIYYYAETESSTFSVNTVSDEITVSNSLIDGLISTGDRITIRKELITDTLPDPIVEAQTYYARRISAGIIKLFNTKADAIANTNVVDLTTAGTGNLKIQKEFFLALAQPVPAIDYYPDMGTYDLRPSMILANVGDTSLFQFIYTQSFDIETHNNDDTAHPAIQTAMNKAGIFALQSQHDYKGQSHDEYPTFEVGVVNNKPVYRKTNGDYGLAQADGTIKELNFVGFMQDGIIKSAGFLNIGTHGFTSGQKIYLSPSIAGNLTTTSNNTEVGVVINSNTILLKKQYIPNIPVVGNTVNVQDEGVFVDAATTLNFVGAIVTASGGGGIVNVTMASTFTSLTDTPANYTGHGGKYVKVNSGATGLEFVSASPNTKTIQYYIGSNPAAGILYFACSTPNPTNLLITSGIEIIRFDRSTTGDRVRIEVTNDPNLTVGNTYFIRKVSSGLFSLHGSMSDAISNTFPIALTTGQFTSISFIEIILPMYDRIVTQATKFFLPTYASVPDNFEWDISLLLGAPTQPLTFELDSVDFAGGIAIYDKGIKQQIVNPVTTTSVDFSNTDVVTFIHTSINGRICIKKLMYSETGLTGFAILKA